MNPLPMHFRAVVLGCNGGLGQALHQQLQADPRQPQVWGFSRRGHPAVDLLDEAALAALAASLQAQGPLHLVWVATGVLHGPGLRPEKRLAELKPEAWQQVFNTNALAPLLALKHLGPLLDKHNSRFGVLSAKVGSIGDNRLGGWLSYRASKSALNMGIKTAAIEWARTHPGAVLAALHPGTVSTALSRPFRGDEIGRPAPEAARQLHSVLEALPPQSSGGFFAYDGQALPW